MKTNDSTPDNVQQTDDVTPVAMTPPTPEAVTTEDTPSMTEEAATQTEAPSAQDFHIALNTLDGGKVLEPTDDENTPDVRVTRPIATEPKTAKPIATTPMATRGKTRFIKVPIDGLGGPQIPICGLDKEVQQIIEDLAESYQCPRDFITVSVFSAAAVAIGRKVHYKYKSYDGGYPSFFFCIVARSGRGKSEPLSGILKPIRDRDAQDYFVYQEAMREYNWAVKKMKKSDVAPEKPVLKQKLISDTTPEALYEALENNPRGLLLYADELASYLLSIGQYNNNGKSGPLSQMLSIWSGMSFQINRKTDGPKYVRNPLLSIIGGTQPGIFATLFGSPMERYNGFNARWLHVWPDEQSPKSPFPGEGDHEEIKARWGEFISELLDGDIEDEDGWGIDVLILSREAKELYEEYKRETDEREAESPEGMSEVYAKLQIYALRWAVVAHLLGPDRKSPPEAIDGVYGSQITKDDMAYTIQCMNYFEYTHKKAYDRITGTDKTNNREDGASSALSLADVDDKDIIGEFCTRFDIESKQAVADVIGKKRSYVSRLVSEYKKGKSYATNTTQTPDEYGKDDESERNRNVVT